MERGLCSTSTHLIGMRYWFPPMKRWRKFWGQYCCQIEWWWNVTVKTGHKWFSCGNQNRIGIDTGLLLCVDPGDLNFLNKPGKLSNKGPGSLRENNGKPSTFPVQQYIIFSAYNQWCLQYLPPTWMFHSVGCDLMNLISCECNFGKYFTTSSNFKNDWWLKSRERLHCSCCEKVNKPTHLAWFPFILSSFILVSYGEEQEEEKEEEEQED